MQPAPAMYLFLFGDQEVFIFVYNYLGHGFYLLFQIYNNIFKHTYGLLRQNLPWFRSYDLCRAERPARMNSFRRGLEVY